MSGPTGAASCHVAPIDVDGRRIDVSVRTEFDGIEYVGRLWFAEPEGGEIADRGALPGRSADEATARARQLTPAELRQRYLRANAERRRYRGLREATYDILAKIRQLNGVAIAVQADLLDQDGAAEEIQAIERQLHELVGRLREVAGVEDEGADPVPPPAPGHEAPGLALVGPNEPDPRGARQR